ncbi:hypothetical protein BJ508DRAFT_413153 [Ascobolus immersus RN42]|uniref:Uncharacterized protein n=1 Tax=Ascobolus immersus RN42 TaxID=1160509 RepID=A0A3N4IE21_ASCIM|nr:hypothetical protein BJ508DRAFT_413153 [Ascobolus immersus RN42]
MSAAQQVLRSRALGKVLSPVKDFISPTPTFLLRTALSSHFNQEPPSSLLSKGSPIPQTNHLVYFPPHVPETLLYQDGHNSEQSPGIGYMRTMWTGHEMEFDENPDNALRIGDEAVMTEQVIVLDDGELTKKTNESGYIKMHFMREYTREGRTTPAITEIRKLLFFKKGGISNGRCEDLPANNPKEEVDPMVDEMLDEEDRIPIARRGTNLRLHPAADFRYTIIPSSILLQRFSSLTYNAHKIHYDPVFARKEGYNGCLVHGPLTTVLMMNALQQHLGKDMKFVKQLLTRNIAPLVADHPIKVCGRKVTRKQAEPRDEWRLWIEGTAGSVAVRAAAIFV